MINTVLPLFGSVVLLLSMFGVIFWLHWQLALFALGDTAVVLVGGELFRKTHTKASRRQRRQEGAMASTAAESMASIKAVQALSLDSKFATSFDANNRKDLQHSVRGATLSNGQRQRIALARMAIRRSPIMILDEPTTGLDRENEIAVVDALTRLSKG